MKKILFIHSSSEMYGSDRSLFNIVNNLDKEKYKAFVVLPSEGILVDYLEQIEGVEVIINEIAVLRRKNLSLKGIIEYMKDFTNSFLFLNHLIKEKKIDIVETNTAVVFPGAIAAKFNHKKSVWHIREIIKNKFENIVISLVMSLFSDVIIANSVSTKKNLKVKPSKVKVVYNSIEKPENIKININKSTDNVAIGMAGRINRWKGQDLFVEAASIVVKKYPSTIFKIAGETYSGESFLRVKLEELITKKGLSKNVILMGQVDNMDDFYNSIDIFVLPSIQPEPFGLVVIEAMQHALPVISTNHGGPTEIIDDDVTGYLVDFKNASEMADKMMYLISNYSKRCKMGQAGLNISKNRYSISNVMKSLYCIYNSLN